MSQIHRLLAGIFTLVFSLDSFGFSSAKVRRRNTDCILGHPYAGQICTGGAIFVGVYSNGKYMVTPGGCTDSATPTCSGSDDTVKRTWRGSAGVSGTVAGLETTVTSPSIMSTQLGQDATPFIVASASVSDDSAAHFCSNLEFGGYDDWFLPTKSEMGMLLCRSVISSYSESYCGTYFGQKTSVITGFGAGGDYWTSTQHGTNSTTSAFYVKFSTGQHSSTNKGIEAYVRCMRRY